ncbi:hypothetical protein [Paenibacillus sp. B-A-8]
MASLSHEAIPEYLGEANYDVKTYYFSDAYALDKQLDEIVAVLKSFQ